MNINNTYLIFGENVICKPSLITRLISKDDSYNWLVVDRWIGDYDEHDVAQPPHKHYTKEAMKVSVDSTWKITKISKDLTVNESWGKYTGIAKIRTENCVLSTPKGGFTAVFNEMIKNGATFYPLTIEHKEMF
ncbi:unnamed protein product [marine sediment metagenome]|uniref:Uncharacterized protein n=1 Tax=marine sediment metagenome TaxID=412755 RepID=X1HTA0_9ZZZZ